MENQNQILYSHLTANKKKISNLEDLVAELREKLAQAERKSNQTEEVVS